MKLITAPEKTYTNKTSVFLAGGITGCPNWQKQAIEKLEDTDLAIYNPRRDFFDPKNAKEQIAWENWALFQADIFSIWFSGCNQTQPICLYELGKYLQIFSLEKVVIGTHPDYPRRFDVEQQLLHVDPNIPISLSLEEHIWRIKNSL